MIVTLNSRMIGTGAVLLSQSSHRVVVIGAGEHALLPCGFLMQLVALAVADFSDVVVIAGVSEALIV